MTEFHRKHPDFSSAEGSPQGEMLMSLLCAFLGERLWWKPVGETPAESAVFLVGGSRAWGVLVEMKERVDGDGWLLEWGFRYEAVSFGVVVQMDFVAHRSRVHEEMDWDRGKAADRLKVVVLPRSEAQGALCDLPVEAVEQIMRGHAPAESQGAQQYAVVVTRPGDGTPAMEMVRGDYPLVD